MIFYPELTLNAAISSLPPTPWSWMSSKQNFSVTFGVEDVGLKRLAHCFLLPPLKHVPVQLTKLCFWRPVAYTMKMIAFAFVLFKL
jgi:hypothetical protein